MPTYRCTSCRGLTDDMDSPQCKEKCRGTNLVKIMQIHLSYADEGKHRIRCLGETPRVNVRTTSSPGAATCVECLAAFRTAMEAKQAAELETPFPFQEDMAEAPETNFLRDSELPARISNKISEFAEASDDPNLQKLNTVEGLAEWLREGNDLSDAINGIGVESEKTVLKFLGIER